MLALSELSKSYIENMGSDKNISAGSICGRADILCQQWVLTRHGNQFSGGGKSPPAVALRCALPSLRGHPATPHTNA